MLNAYVYNYDIDGCMYSEADNVSTLNVHDYTIYLILHCTCNDWLAAGAVYST